MSDGCVTWSEANLVWNETNYTWSEICLIVEVVTQGGGYSGQAQRLRNKDKTTQKKFIKLLCRVKGEEYSETKYFRPDVRVRAADFNLIEKFLKKPEISIFINKQK